MFSNYKIGRIDFNSVRFFRLSYNLQLSNMQSKLLPKALEAKTWHADDVTSTSWVNRSSTTLNSFPLVEIMTDDQKRLKFKFALRRDECTIFYERRDYEAFAGNHQFKLKCRKNDLNWGLNKFEYIFFFITS